MKPIRSLLTLLTLPLIMSCQSDILSQQKPAETVTEVVCEIPTHPVRFCATVVDGSSSATRATLTTEKHYAYAASDMLYVEGIGENADKVYGVLGLATKDIGKTTGVVFVGDLQVADGFTPTDDMPLTAVLVGRDDLLYTFDNEKPKILSMAYPQANAIVPTVAKAVERYSNMRAEGTFGERKFDLTQNSCFVNFSVTFADGTAAGTDIGVYVWTDNNDPEPPTDLRTGTVTTVADGDAVKANFVVAFPKETQLNGAVIGLGTRTPIAFGGTTTLAANKIYNVNKTFNKSAGSAAYEYTALTKSNPDFIITQYDNPLTIVGDGTATYSSSNTDVATVDATTGDVTIVGAGTAVIKATIADGINYTYAGNNEATCTLTVKDPVALADVTAAENLGWVIGSDKQAYVTATGASAAGVTPVAMIGYVGSAGSADASSATYRGLAVALQDVYLDPGTTTLWSNAQGTCTTTVVLLSDAMTVCNGIAVTASLVGCTSHVHQAASMANSYNTDLETPMGCSDWFLPSVGQWCKVLEACGIDFSGWTEFGYGPGGAVNYTTAQALISAVGDPFSTTKYWTSTEYNARFAWTVEFDSESGIGLDVPMKTTTYGNVYNVRPFMAF